MICIAQYERKARQCSPNVLCDALFAVLKVVNEIPNLDQEINQKLEAALSHINASGSSKAVVKRRPAPKKKAPPPKANGSAAVKSLYYPLFWVATSGEPPSLQDVVDDVLPLDSREVVRHLQIGTADVTTYLEAPATSVYGCKLNEESTQKLMRAIQSPGFIDTYFAKRTTKAEKTTVAHAPKPLQKRVSLVPASYAQRYGILIYTLKKTYGSLANARQAILDCTLGQNEIGLLSETLQNPIDNDELLAGVRSIHEALREHSYDWLYEDEQFLLFISQIPNIRERMCCLYVASTFTAMSVKLCSRMSQIRTAINLLATSRNVHLIHQLLLALGNKLNTNTARGNATYFKLSTFAKIVDVKGQEGMTLARYIAHFVKQVCELPDEYKFVSKAAQFGVINTYTAVRNLIDTYMVIAGFHSTSSATPRNADPPLVDKYESVALEYARNLLPAAQSLAEEYYAFLATYSSAAYFFGDPNALLPLDAPSKSDDAEEDGPGKDLLHRYVALNNLLEQASFGAKSFEWDAGISEQENIPSTIQRTRVRQPRTTPTRTKPTPLKAKMTPPKPAPPRASLVAPSVQRPVEPIAPAPPRRRPMFATSAFAARGVLRRAALDDPSQKRAKVNGSPPV